MHFLSARFHRRHWDLEIVEYYTFQTIFKIAYGTLTLFQPIYMLEIGYSLREIALWFVINELFFLVAVPFMGRVVQRLGLKKSIALKLPILAIYYFLIQRLTGQFSADLWLILPLLLMRAVGKSPSQIAEDLFMAKHVLRRRAQGKMLALTKILAVLAGVISPLVGGLIAYTWGFNAMFSAGCILMLVSAIPLFLTPDEHFEAPYSAEAVATFPFRRINRSYLIAEAGRTLPDTLVWVMWPLFIYFIIHNAADLGALVSASAFLSMVLSYYVGKRIDQSDPQKMLSRGVRSYTGLFFLRSIALHPVLMSIVDVCTDLFSPLIEIPYDYYVFGYMRRQPNQLQAATAKDFIEELWCFIGTVLVLFATLIAPRPDASFFVGVFLAFALLCPLVRRISTLAEARMAAPVAVQLPAQPGTRAKKKTAAEL